MEIPVAVLVLMGLLVMGLLMVAAGLGWYLGQRSAIPKGVHVQTTSVYSLEQVPPGRYQLRALYYMADPSKEYGSEEILEGPGVMTLSIGGQFILVAFEKEQYQGLRTPVCDVRIQVYRDPNRPLMCFRRVS